MLNRILQNQAPIIYGDGEQKRCFSYIDDVVECLEKMALDEKISKEIINIGPDEQTISILKLAQLVANATGYNGEPIFVKDRPKEVKFASCSSNKARKLLDYKTKTSLEKAVIKTTEFIKKRGARDFNYHLPLEILNSKTPETWSKKLI